MVEHKQTKTSWIINNKYGINELPQELPNNLKRRILGNYTLHRIAAQSLVLPLKLKFVSNAKKFTGKQKLNFSRGALFQMKIRVCLKYFLKDCLWKQFLVSNLLYTPSKFTCMAIFVTLTSLTQFNLILEVLRLQESTKFSLTV